VGRITPDATKVVPYYVKDWDYSDDYKTFTLYLREGMKWSDGESFTADDYMYWWEHIANNKDLNPVGPEKLNPPLLNVEKRDQYTVVYTLGKSSPFYHANLGDQGLIEPEHYMKQFHPDFVDKDQLMEIAKDVGFDTWFEYYEYMSSVAYPERGVRPTLRPYVFVKTTESYMEAERNPYFPFVDTEGNQLPYIDKVRLNLANNRKMAQTKAATGEVTFAGRDLNPADIPLYKKNEKTAGHKTYVFKSQGTDWSVFINVGNKEAKLREVFQDDRFRKALSLAIDRDEVNQKVYFGLGTPLQASLMPDSKYIDPSFLKAFADYDIERAKKMLDDMGMKDVNNDGFREYPDGEDFKIILDHWDPTVTKHGELLVEYWKNIGIETDFKQLSWNLNMQKRQAYESQLMLSWNSTTSDLEFPNNPGRFAPTANTWPGNESWYSFIDWFASDGKNGIEPPVEYKELHELAMELMSATDKQRRIEIGKKIMKAQAENIYVIGIVGLAPVPLVVDQDMKNMVTTGYWGPAANWYSPYYPIQNYFTE